jgi:hypothetical protein
MEAVPAEDRTWIAGVPTRHSDHQTKSPPSMGDTASTLSKPNFIETKFHEIS